ncbi:uncharacterized protein VICG_01416 [Vittaforma corneae ATCC 50505]|uniref:YbaK/aminoacyl-tRNA synthetase-associated domain-containing protein n=1 Tax=Vittaforma corneae (strain ATCC 50505) TaxID=993615 RepID=L2GMM2_VITCO|nr:uncharacterized protein VICG_01416 [Vittaforma corneae ATCC 50505]ELA41552.1 hypothetical protein VICG_01416 [Vittaforma corneae ATCC 50505]
MIEVKTDAVNDLEYQKNSARVLESIKNMLSDNKTIYKIDYHEPAGASKDVAKLRNERLEDGGKAMILKINDEFKLFVLSAAKIISFKKIKARFSSKKVRFANNEELKALTGLVPGCIPPFGRPILPLDIFLDNSILENNTICFNAGSLTASIEMSVEDYLKLINGERFDFSE